MIFPLAVAPVAYHQDNYTAIHNKPTKLPSFDVKNHSEIQLWLGQLDGTANQTHDFSNLGEAAATIFVNLNEGFISVEKLDDGGGNMDTQNLCNAIRDKTNSQLKDWIPLKNMHYKQQDLDHSTRSYQWQVKGNQQFYISVANCADFDIEFSYTVTVSSLDLLGMPTRLPSDLQNLPFLLAVMFGGVWPLIMAIWFIYLYKYRQYCLPLHKLLTFVPLLRFVWSALMAVIIYRLAYHGEIGYSAEIALYTVTALNCLFESAIIMLLSKGWCITRSQLTFTERRTIWGTAFFTGGAYLCQYIDQGPIIGVYTVFFCLVFIRSLSCLWHQREELLRYLHMLIAQKSHRTFLMPHYEKLQVFVRFQWLILMGNVFPVAVYYAVITRMPNARQNFYVYLIQDVAPAVYIIILLFIFRPRTAKIIDLSEASTLRQTQDRALADSASDSNQMSSSAIPGIALIRRRFLTSTGDLSPGTPVIANQPVFSGMGVTGAWQHVLTDLRERANRFYIL